MLGIISRMLSVLGPETKRLRASIVNNGSCPRMVEISPLGSCLPWQEIQVLLNISSPLRAHTLLIDKRLKTKHNDINVVIFFIVSPKYAPKHFKGLDESQKQIIKNSVV